MYLLIALLATILAVVSGTTDAGRMYLLIVGILIIIDLLGDIKKILKEDKKYDDKNS